MANTWPPERTLSGRSAGRSSSFSNTNYYPSHLGVSLLPHDPGRLQPRCGTLELGDLSPTPPRGAGPPMETRQSGAQSIQRATSLEAKPPPPDRVLSAPPFPASGIASSSAPASPSPVSIPVGPPSVRRSAGPPVHRRPQLAVTYSPGNPGAFHALLPSRGTRHIPARRPLSGARVGWGGAEQGGACGLARFAPYARLHRAPCGRGADQAAESKGEVVVTPARTRRVGRGERQGSCQEVSREVEGIARDVAPPCGQRAGVLGRWARGQASALCPPL